MAACAAGAHAADAAAAADHAGRNQGVEDAPGNGNGAAAADEVPKARRVAREQTRRKGLRIQRRRPALKRSETPRIPSPSHWAPTPGMPAGNRLEVLFEKSALCPEPTGWADSRIGRRPRRWTLWESLRPRRRCRSQVRPGGRFPPREPAGRQVRDDGVGRLCGRVDGEKGLPDRAEDALARKVLTDRWAALLKHHWESLSEKALERALRRIEGLWECQAQPDVPGGTPALALLPVGAKCRSRITF